MVTALAEGLCYNTRRMKFAEDIRGVLRIGLASARANLVPMIVLWMMAVGLVLGYCLVSEVRGWLGVLEEWQERLGWSAAFVSQALFCGFLPGVFQIAMKRIRPRRIVLTILAQLLWCGFSGVIVNIFFRMLGCLVGADASLPTLVVKTVIDQFVWTVFIVAPANTVFFFWVGRDFSFARAKAEWPRDFIAKVYLPNLISNWCVWIPTIFLVFAFPVALQVHLCGIACSFWILMCVQLGRLSGR